MKPVLSFLLFILSFSFLEAQPKTNNSKYPSLLWEITGNGLTKPSYLIGTMHVSSKLAFNLPDSFYIAIKNAQVVALESNPEIWQEEMSKYELGLWNRGGEPYQMVAPDDYFNVNTLKLTKYVEKLKSALYSNPSAINNLLYRSYGNENSDFEEDTYLDMYIFQCGKKWKKQLAGVENYGESMKLMAEAYQDAARDKNPKQRSFTDASEDFSEDKLEHAYRTGNLDLLDSINRYNSVSTAFDEKFLYRRNEIQAHSIDSILRTGATLFAGVGAAHLPGERGVIEMLRRMGFRLRPVKMGERASRTKELVDLIRVPVQFRKETSPDGMIQVEIPGKFYQFGDDPLLDQRQFADMSNGSYYMVTRIQTNAGMWDHSETDVYRTVDSLLYENIPGKIISKSPLLKNGYRGFDITNRTRRGDLQRYQIFITPVEVILFKMSGNGDYVKNGPEANRFFGSIRLKESENKPGWNGKGGIKFSPSGGGFSVTMPHEPFTNKAGNWTFEASDPNSGVHYRVIRTDVHNYNFIGSDSMDLAMMEESFGSSECMDSQSTRQPFLYMGYPALESRFLDKQGHLFLVRFIISGPHYYTLVSHGKKEIQDMKNFLNSFRLQPFLYGKSGNRSDSLLFFNAHMPDFNEKEKINLGLPAMNFGDHSLEEEDPVDEKLGDGLYRSKTIRNDTTGERIHVSYYRLPSYYFIADGDSSEMGDSDSWFRPNDERLIRLDKKVDGPGGMRVRERISSDSGSSRAIWEKYYYKDGVRHTISTLIDTLSAPSSFLNDFFNSFSPSDTVKGINPFLKKSEIFFRDFMSSDSMDRRRAVKHIIDIELDSTDLPLLIQAMNRLTWQEKKYLDNKIALINKLGEIKTGQSADVLYKLYGSVGDTIALQFAVLENLLQHKTQYAYDLFRNIIRSEPPVLDPAVSGVTDYPGYEFVGGNYQDGRFMDELTDSLKLTRAILPDLLPLLDLEDYKGYILRLLGRMVDSNLIGLPDYEKYYNRFLLEARQALKKQTISEKKKNMQEAENKKPGVTPVPDYFEENELGTGNDNLSLYAQLLLPFWKMKPEVQSLVNQILGSNDNKLKYSMFLMLLKQGKEFPDSLLTYFAGLDACRYLLYRDLKKEGNIHVFPARYNNHFDLGLSSLLQKKLFGKPDSVAYIDRLPTEYLGKNGFLYFYKYKEKKDDLNWRLAVTGLTPADPHQFEFEDSASLHGTDFFGDHSAVSPNRYTMTEFTEVRLKEDEPIPAQLLKLKKRLLFVRSKSGLFFYDDRAESSE